MDPPNAFSQEEEEPTTILNLLFFVSPWSLTESGLCAATNNVSRQKPLTRIYICDGVMGLLVVLCLWLIDCRGHLSLKSLHRPCVVWRVDDLKLSFYCTVELIDLSLPPSIFFLLFSYFASSLSISVHTESWSVWIIGPYNTVEGHPWKMKGTLIKFKVELKGDEEKSMVQFSTTGTFLEIPNLFFSSNVTCIST